MLNELSERPRSALETFSASVSSILSSTKYQNYVLPSSISITNNMTKLDLLIGDITNTDADIIVFSAHPSLLAGSGVSGAIHNAAGKELEAAAKKFTPLKVKERSMLFSATPLSRFFLVDIRSIF